MYKETHVNTINSLCRRQMSSCWPISQHQTFLQPQKSTLSFTPPPPPPPAVPAGHRHVVSGNLCYNSR